MASVSEEGFVMINCAPQKIETRVISGLVTADLTKYDFVGEFPDFTTCNNLQVIRMPTFTLKHIPKEKCKIPNSFCCMKCLKKLCLYGDDFEDKGLTCLPQDFGRLTTLEHLNLQHNNFSRFPEQICALTNLKTLYLNSCGLTSISTNINKLINLEEADFGQNDFSGGLPKELFDLPKLKDLYLIECHLNHLPPEIGNLEQLQGIRLNDNNLEELPEELFTLKHLKKLNANNNRISRISPNIIYLESLEFLFLKNNNLNVLPKEISKLLNLSVVNVSYNKLTCLPDTITEVNSSVQFTIQGNYYLQKPPSSICLKGINSIKGFFESMKRDKPVHSNRIKIVVFGEAGAGKTCLTNALVHCYATDPAEDDSTLGVEMHHWTIEQDGLEACVVDLAGQRRYQLTHPFFLSEESLHILVVNLKEYQCNALSFQKNVEDWIDWVTARLVKPCIMIVATHMDECTEKQITDKCKDILKRIQDHENKEIKRLKIEKRKLQKKSTCSRDVEADLENLTQIIERRPVISSKCLFASQPGKSKKVEKDDPPYIAIVPVSSKNELQGMSPLREEIKKVVKSKVLFPSVGQDLPQSWVELEEAIKNYREVCAPQVPCMTLQEFQKFGFEKASLSGNELMSALDYLDTVGEIKFYKKMPDNEYSVYLDLQWLCKTVKLLFRHDFCEGESKNLLEFKDDYAEFELEEIGFHQLVNELKDNGVLSINLLRCIWYELQLNDEEFQKLIKAMVCFGLACELPMTNLHPRSLLIPWFLHSEIKPEEKEQIFPNTPNNSDIEYRLRYSFSGYLPAGVFDRLCVHSYALGFDASTWKNSMIIYIQSDIKIFLEVEKTITVTGRTGSQSSEDLWIALLKIVEELELLLKEWPSLLWKTFTVCPHCVKCKEVDPHYFDCKWLEGQGPFSFRCRKTSGMHISEDLIVPSKDLLKRYYGPVEPFSENVSDLLIVEVSKSVIEEWKILAIYLGFTNDEVNIIDYDHTKKIQEKTIEMLQTWKSKYGSAATRTRLIAELKAVGKTNVAESVLKYRDN